MLNPKVNTLNFKKSFKLGIRENIVGDIKKSIGFESTVRALRQHMQNFVAGKSISIENLLDSPKILSEWKSEARVFGPYKDFHSMHVNQ